MLGVCIIGDSKFFVAQSRNAPKVAKGGLFDFLSRLSSDVHSQIQLGASA